MENNQRERRDSFICYKTFFLDEFPDSEQQLFLWWVAKYALMGQEPQFESPYLRQQWKTAKAVLDANYKKWLNGKGGGAPEGNQNALKTTKKQPNVNENENVNVNVNENVSGGFDQRDRERVFEKFFFKNFKDPAGETDRYWDNYAGQGWKTSKGAAIEDKVAYCSGWRPLDERPRFNTDAIKAFELLYKKVAGGGKNNHRLLEGLLNINQCDDGGLVLIYDDKEGAQAMANLLDMHGLRRKAQVKIVKNNQKTTYG